MKFEIVVAFCSNGGIGKDNNIPWSIKDDLLHFKTITSTCPPCKRNAVIMGRNTWDSLPKRPLTGRLNIVVSTSYTDNPPMYPNVAFVKSLKNALDIVKQHENIAYTFVIGGSRLYLEALCHPDCNKVHVTHVLEDFNCDTFFPVTELHNHFKLNNEGSINQSPQGMTFSFCEYLRKEDTT